MNGEYTQKNFTVLHYLGLIFLMSMLSSCQETLVNEFEELDNEARSELIQKGWLPNWIPSNVIQFVEIHNLDSNASFFSFQTTSSIRGVVETNCKVEPTAEKPRITTPGFSEKMIKGWTVYRCSRFYITFRGTQVFGWMNGH